MIELQREIAYDHPLKSQLLKALEKPKKTNKYLNYDESNVIKKNSSKFKHSKDSLKEIIEKSEYKKTKKDFVWPEVYFMGRLKFGPSIGPDINLGVTKLTLQAEATERFEVCVGTKTPLMFKEYPYVGANAAIGNVVGSSVGLNLKEKVLKASVYQPLGAGIASNSKYEETIVPYETYYYVGGAVGFGIPNIVSLGSLYGEVGIAIANNKDNKDSNRNQKLGDYELQEFV